MVQNGTKLVKMTSVAKEKSDICHISFTFPITVANENFNLARALGLVKRITFWFSMIVQV
jgi:hypothetical protein